MKKLSTLFKKDPNNLGIEITNLNKNIMKELQEVRNEVLHLKNMGVINKQEETKLLHKLNALEAAISVTRCCTELKDKKVLSFEEYIDAYYERKDFKYFNKRGKSFKSTEILQIYDEHIHNL